MSISHHSFLFYTQIFLRDRQHSHRYAPATANSFPTHCTSTFLTRCANRSPFPTHYAAWSPFPTRCTTRSSTAPCCQDEAATCSSTGKTRMWQAQPSPPRAPATESSSTGKARMPRAQALAPSQRAPTRCWPSISCTGEQQAHLHTHTLTHG
jgi:hypothetical protein